MCARRRVQPGETGAHVLLERQRQPRRTRTPLSIRIEVDHQVAHDTDVRKLLELVRVGLGLALAGKSSPTLEMAWSVTDIAGDHRRARTAIKLSSSDGDEYLQRIFERTAKRVVPEIVDRWLDDAVPKGGEGVGTPATFDAAAKRLRPRGR